MKIYLASSWRNKEQPAVLKALRDAGHEVYDFRDADGFHWSWIDPDWKEWTPRKFIDSLDHTFAELGYLRDWDAMNEADACVLLMPCGRSAHLEAGWFVGSGRSLIIFASDCEPELMYKMANKVVTTVEEVLEELSVLGRKVKND